MAAATRFGGGVLMGTALSVYVRDGGSPFAVSTVYAAYFLGLMLFAPVWGAVADVTGRRRSLLVATGLLSTLAVLPLLVADGVWLPIGLRGLYAVFAAGFPPVMLAIVSARGGEAGRGRSVGFFNSARAAGFTGGQLAAGALLGLLAPTGLYLVIAALSLVSTATVVLLDDPTPSPDADPTLGEVVGEVRHRLLPAIDEREHLRANGLRWLYVALALRNMTVLGVNSLVPVYLLDGVGVSAFVMGVLLAMNPAGQTVCMVLFGRIADRTGRKPSIVLGMSGSGLFALVMAAATLPDALVVRVAVATLAFVLIAASYSAMTTGALAFIGDVAPVDRESELMGLRTTAKGVGGVVGPPLFGVVATIASFRAAFAGGSVLAFAATVLVVLALVESREPADDSAALAADD